VGKVHRKVISDTLTPRQRAEDLFGNVIAESVSAFVAGHSTYGRVSSNGDSGSAEKAKLTKENNTENDAL